MAGRKVCFALPGEKTTNGSAAQATLAPPAEASLESVGQRLHIQELVDGADKLQLNANICWKGPLDFSKHTPPNPPTALSCLQLATGPTLGTRLLDNMPNFDEPAAFSTADSTHWHYYDREWPSTIDLSLARGHAKVVLAGPMKASSWPVFKQPANRSVAITVIVVGNHTVSSLRVPAGKKPLSLVVAGCSRLESLRCDGQLHRLTVLCCDALCTIFVAAWTKESCLDWLYTYAPVDLSSTLLTFDDAGDPGTIRMAPATVHLLYSVVKVAFPVGAQQEIRVVGCALLTRHACDYEEMTLACGAATKLKLHGSRCFQAAVRLRAMHPNLEPTEAMGEFQLYDASEWPRHLKDAFASVAGVQVAEVAGEDVPTDSAEAMAMDYFGRLHSFLNDDMALSVPFQGETTWQATRRWGHRLLPVWATARAVKQAVGVVATAAAAPLNWVRRAVTGGERVVVQGVQRVTGAPTGVATFLCATSAATLGLYATRAVAFEAIVGTAEIIDTYPWVVPTAWGHWAFVRPWAASVDQTIKDKAVELHRNRAALLTAARARTNQPSGMMVSAAKPARRWSVPQAPPPDTVVLVATETAEDLWRILRGLHAVSLPGESDELVPIGDLYVLDTVAETWFGTAPGVCVAAVNLFILPSNGRSAVQPLDSVYALVRAWRSWPAPDGWMRRLYAPGLRMGSDHGWPLPNEYRSEDWAVVEQMHLLQPQDGSVSQELLHRWRDRVSEAPEAPWHVSLQDVPAAAGPCLLALAEWPRLPLQLTLSGCALDDTDVHYLANVQDVWHHLFRLDLRRNNLTQASVAFLLASIRQAGPDVSDVVMIILLGDQRDGDMVLDRITAETARERAEFVLLDPPVWPSSPVLTWKVDEAPPSMEPVYTSLPAAAWEMDTDDEAVEDRTFGFDDEAFGDEAVVPDGDDWLAPVDVTLDDVARFSAVGKPLPGWNRMDNDDDMDL
jgi:hypothetical protein